MKRCTCGAPARLSVGRHDYCWACLEATWPGYGRAREKERQQQSQASAAKAAAGTSTIMQPALPWGSGDTNV